MFQRQMFVFSICVLLARSKASSESRFNGDTSGGEREEELNNNEQQLQATAATSMHRQQQQHKERDREREQQQQQTQEEEQQRHRHPVNYYAYNHRYNPRSNLENTVGTGGNYKQVRPDLYNSPSYVLAISQTMRRGSSSSTSIGGFGGLPAEIEGESLRHQLTPPALKDVQEVDMRGGQEVRRADDFVALTNAPLDDTVNGLLKPSAAAVLEVDNYLAPFEQAVVKVRNFCEILRSLISADDDATMETETEADTEEEEEVEAQQQQLARLPGDAVAVAVAANAANKLDGRASWATSKEVQGRNIRLAASSPPYQGRKLKKLKKKIQKLLLPLLIAYKLKFLTLIPVLIGGLTLLVGTTGLAGFFFALFTAVMSLKTSTGAGHGSKAIVLKKI